jgi:outer membrane protein TolC
MKARSFAVVVSVWMAGCSVGPKYTRPTIAAPPAYKEAEGWKTAQPGDRQLRGAWWEIFGDSQLNALEAQLAISNRDLKAA